MVLALTVGDPSGIGPDIALMAWQLRKQAHVPPFLLIADPEQIAQRAARLGFDIAIRESNPADAQSHFTDVLPVLPLIRRHAENPGVPDGANAAGTIEAIDLAVELALSGEAGAVVTCPIAKKPLYDAGFQFPGHTEYLAYLAGQATGHTPLPVMLIASPLLRTVPVTIHIPLKEIPLALTTDLIIKTCRIVAADMKWRFGLSAPRLAVSGLNPHAGEGGALGAEDEAVIVPAIAALKSEGIDAFGPLPADTMFHASAREAYDVAICMYHDQALIPAKALAFDEGVNVTLGLPFVRTSPDHGTAFSLAGTGKARPDSLIAALKMAASMAAHNGKPA